MNHSWEDDQSPAFFVERELRKLVCGEFSSISITFNDFASNYMTAAQVEAEGGMMFEHAEWVSDEEKRLAIEKNSVWCIQWYPDTPVGFCALLASSLEALMVALTRSIKEMKS